MTFTWPSVLKARSWNAHLRNSVASGGRSASGREQRVHSDAGFWELAISGIVVRNREQANAYRALIAALRDGEDVFVPICDPYKTFGARSVTASAVAFAAAPLRATTVHLVVNGLDIQPGQYFTHGNRMHMVRKVLAMTSAFAPVGNPISSDKPWDDSQPWADQGTSSSVTYSLQILPPLRTELPPGAPVDFANPRLLCVIGDPKDGDLSLDLGRFATPSLTLVESPAA